MTILDKPHQIEFASFLALRGALKLENLGMKRRGKSAYAIAKERLKIKGNRQAVYTQLCEHVEKLKLANYKATTEEAVTKASEERLLKPFKDEGRQAALQGCPRADCPYGMEFAMGAGSVEPQVRARRAWMEGYASVQPAERRAAKVAVRGH